MNHYSGSPKDNLEPHRAHLESKGYIVETTTVDEACAENQKYTNIADKTWVPIYVYKVVAPALKVYEQNGDRRVYQATLWFDLLGNDATKMHVVLK